MFTAVDPVASGRHFDMTAVHGRPPHVLDDFVGEAVFTLHWQEQDRLVAGSARAVGVDIVRFTEKDLAHSEQQGRPGLVDRPGGAAGPVHPLDQPVNRAGRSATSRNCGVLR